MKFPNRKSPPPRTEIHRKRLSENNARYWLGKQRKDMTEKIKGEKNYLWKGDRVSYSGLHKRLVRWYGNAKDNPCFMCGRKLGEVKRLEWANVDGKYMWDKDKWVVMCSHCHALYDRRCPVYNLF